MGPWTLDPASPFWPVKPLLPVQTILSGKRNTSHLHRLSINSRKYLTLFSRISKPSRSPSGANTPPRSPTSGRALRPWYTWFPGGPHGLFNRSWLTTYLSDKFVELQHFLWKTHNQFSQLSLQKNTKKSQICRWCDCTHLFLLCTSCSQACVTSW